MRDFETCRNAGNGQPSDPLCKYCKADAPDSWIDLGFEELVRLERFNSALASLEALAFPSPSGRAR